jgi:hypothetical protein
VGVSQLGHCTCLRLASGQPHSDPRLASLPCHPGRRETGYGFEAACPDSRHFCGRGRSCGRSRCRRHDGPWGEWVLVLGCRTDDLSARRGGPSRGRRDGLDRGTGGGHRERRSRSGRGTGEYRVGRGARHGAVSIRGASGFGAIRRPRSSTTSRARGCATGFCLDVCRSGQHHRFVQSEAGELPLRFPLHPS